MYICFLVESTEGVTSHLTSALLLNTQHYSFLFSRETQLEPGVVGGSLLMVVTMHVTQCHIISVNKAMYSTYTVTWNSVVV